MKKTLLYENLLKLVNDAGIAVHKDKLIKSKGGYCLLNDNKLIVLNSALPIETRSRLLAESISELGLLTDGMFIPPALRKYIENEIALKTTTQADVEFQI